MSGPIIVVPLGVHSSQQDYKGLHRTSDHFGHQSDTQIPVQFLSDKLPTPVKLQVLRDLLYNCNYDVVETEYLLDSFSKGFSFFCEKTSFQMDCKNLKSALEKPDVISDKLCKELQANRIAGPFLDRPCKNVNVSPLGLCPKKEKGKFRLIFQ
jgi:hypothetical protein